MVALTRNIRRQVRCTHDFQPLTARMIKNAGRPQADGELVTVGALASTAQNPKPRHSKPNPQTDPPTPRLVIFVLGGRVCRRAAHRSKEVGFSY